jgi:hypothetical protein
LALGVEIFELRACNGDERSTDKGPASINSKQQEAISGNHSQIECVLLQTQVDHHRKLIAESPRLHQRPIGSPLITFHSVHIKFTWSILTFCSSLIRSLLPICFSSSIRSPFQSAVRDRFAVCCLKNVEGSRDKKRGERSMKEEERNETN